ncbi:MAG: hypothetical protein U0637_05735 [Phycisphaerales bacterium]
MTALPFPASQSHRSDRTSTLWRAWAARVAPFWAGWAVAFAALLIAPSAAWAQSEETEEEGSDTASEGQPTEGEQGPSLPGAFEGEIAVSVEKFGVGDVARAGDWAGFLVKVHDSASKPRDVLIRVANTDADGDLPTQQRLVATNPGRDQLFWVYMRLAYEDFRRRPIEVTVYEAVDNKVDDAPPELKHRPGRLLGRSEIAPRMGGGGQLRGPSEGMLGLISTTVRPLALNEYSTRNPNDPYSSRGQEVTNVIHMTLDDVPDRWMGLAAMDTLVWASGDISQLRLEKARAIREWVERGGHLVIILPTVGQAWTTPGANELFPLLPSVIVDREETADYRPYRPLITADRKSNGYPDTGVLHTFRATPQAAQADATPILCGPDGGCVAVRKLVGAGAVTMIGLDLNNDKLQRFLEADIFWHRVLGRRGDFTPVKQQQSSMQGSRFRSWNVDKDITEIISVKSASALGALLGFALFALYWLAVGPPGYFLLKKHNLHKHAWLGFVGGSVVFTVIAWGGARALRPFRTEANHFTIIDHVFGQPTERARVWANVMVPRYGDARISVGGPTGTDDPSLCSIAPWENPDDTSGTAGSFPDSRNYTIDTLTPDALDVPVRSTVKTVQADWAGPPVLGMPRPVDASGAGVGEIRLTPNWNIGSSESPYTGTIAHDLPFSLTNVTIIIVKGQSRVTGTAISDLLANADVLTVTGEWKPGLESALDLEVLRKGLDKPNATSLASMLGVGGSLVPATSEQFGLGEVVDHNTKEQHLLAMSLFQLLPAPNLANDSQGAATVPQRRSMHGLDLSRWFTQPCVIVIGFTSGEGKAGRCPVPMYISDIGGRPEELASKGMTMVRWVYPLPARPPEVRAYDDYMKSSGRSVQAEPADANGRRPEGRPEPTDKPLPGEEGGN